MDFDEAKENIQPLAAGRNASILQAALHAESHQGLQQQRRSYEEAIQKYEGDDPLEPWFDYIYWIEQSFPSGGKESGLEEVLLKCLTKFEKDERYHQDRRMIKLYIKYIDTLENPQECYQKLYHEGIGTMVADLYICWAYYYDLMGNFRKADQIFRTGIECRAHPLEELQEAHQHFGFTMSQRILYNDDNSQQKYHSSLQEKRHALTSLRSHKKKVGSIRTGAAVKSSAPGKIQLSNNNPNTSSRVGNINVQVFEDENQNPNSITNPEPTPSTSKSFVKAILDSARKQENIKEPGPWNKAHDKKKGQLFSSETRTDLGFEILEDDDDVQPIKGKLNYNQPFIYFPGFVAYNKPQEHWNLPVTLENELCQGAYPSYDKCLIYPQPNLEFSLEELGCYYWCKKRNIENKFTKKYDAVWKSSLETGIRMYPNFARKNLPMAEDKTTDTFDPFECLLSGKCKFVIDLKLCYPSNEEELQFEEIMFRRWKNGERKLKYGGNETIAFSEEMEETMCLPNEAPRRKSFFPTRKSIAPANFLRTTNLQEQTEEHLPQTSNRNKSGIFMKTPKKAKPTEAIQVFEDETPDEPFQFKAPTAPSLKQQKLNFQIYEEEEENNFEANETCSTQVFNCFIKAQSVSTPKAPSKPVKMPPTESQPTSLNFSGIENMPQQNLNLNPTPPFSPPEDNDVGLTLHGKQLSTIMETSEQATGNTGSTKSSISGPDFDIDVQQSRVPLINNVCTLETVQEAGSLSEKDYMQCNVQMKSMIIGESPAVIRNHNEISRLEQSEDTVPTMPTVKIFEDKTETVPKTLLTKAGNFLRLEDKEDTTPSIKPVKFYEDKTETIPKIMLAPKIETNNQIPTGDEMVELFAKSPQRSTVPFGTSRNAISPSKQVPNKSILNASVFDYFQDSPVAKLKCNYESPELIQKRAAITTNKAANISFLPNFDDQPNTDVGAKNNTNLSFLPDMSNNTSNFMSQKPTKDSLFLKFSNQDKNMEDFGPGKSSKRHHTKDNSIFGGFTKGPQPNASLQKSILKDNSFLPVFSKDTSTNNISSKQIPKEDSFLSGFPSVAVGNNKAQEDSFMLYLSKAESSKNKQAAEDSFTKKSSKNILEPNDAKPKTPTDNASFKIPDSSFIFNSSKKITTKYEKIPGDSILSTSKLETGTTKNTNAEKRILKSFTVDESQSKILDSSRKENVGNSILSNLSATNCNKAQSDDIVMEEFSVPKPISQIPRFRDSKMNTAAVPDISQARSSKVSFLNPHKDTSITKAQQHADKPDQNLSKNINFDEQMNVSKQRENQSNLTMSFFGDFSVSEQKKQPEQVEKFHIFEDSNCKKSLPASGQKEINKFTIFEDSKYEKAPSVSREKFNPLSPKPDDFFEDNIRTEAFAANLSMIKNSTWLPNHNPRQSQIREPSLNIKEELSTSNQTLSNNEKSRGLSIFSSLSQEKTQDLMPPPPSLMQKVPTSRIPSEQIVQPNDCIEINESDEEKECEEIGKSIYYTKTPKTPKMSKHAWSPETIEEDSEENHFIHHEVDLDQTQQVIDGFFVDDDVNPFNKKLTDAFLNQVDITTFLEELPTCQMVRNVTLLKKDSTIEIRRKTFNVIKLIGEGSFGSVFSAKEPQSGKLYALKQERPANLWEYYICLELQSRIHNTEILPGFAQIEYAMIGNNASILVSALSRYGSLIAVCNKIKKHTLRNVDEFVVMHMTSQLLLIIDHLHASNIIHADIKADNFLLMEKLILGRKQPTIQLIDFGTSIDMNLFKRGQTFKYICENESFKCVEMREKRPWTYQLDLFGLAGVIHVLLFGKYMEIVKKSTAWTHKTHVPRYFKKSLWETIFHSLLNVSDCQTMPNLQNLRAQLEEEIAENDKMVCQKIIEFNRALDA